MSKETEHNPYMYTVEEMDAITKHCDKYFGKSNRVFHELVSPDIHLDLIPVPPTKERNFYTFITMGSGAYKMDVPDGAKRELKTAERAEYVICLPVDWAGAVREDDYFWFLHSSDVPESIWWPMRLLKTMGRFAFMLQTWLGFGHTLQNDKDYKPYVEGVKFTSCILDNTQYFGEKSYSCKLPNGEKVAFYQIIPLYDEEIILKMFYGMAELLLKRFGKKYSPVIDIHRKNYANVATDKFKIKPADIKQVYKPKGKTAPKADQMCVVSNKIVVDGMKVARMERIDPTYNDSGWCFMGGTEDDAYIGNLDNTSIITLNELCNYDPDVMKFLNIEIGTGCERDENGNFQTFEMEDDE